MEIYKIIELENTDILLQKYIIDNNNYIIIDKENGDKLLKKINIIDIKDIKNYDFGKSIILDCKINNNNNNIKLKYKSILSHIYILINDGTIIIKNTLLNIKTIKKTDNGFYYMNNLGISIQCVDSNKCVDEITTQCNKNNINIEMKIKLINNIIVYIKN
jgi:hypothetical protein